MTESTLICTLGGQPQIVTFALDWLLARGESVSEVFVFHLSPQEPRFEQSLRRLHREFSGGRYRGRACRFRAVPLKRGAEVLPAIRSEVEAEAVRQAVFSVIAELKQAGRTLHLCIAGGPRMMGLMALSAASLFCGHADKVWHMHTDPDFRAEANEGAVMHDDSGERVRLVPVPMVPWASYLPPFVGRSPADLLHTQTAWMVQTERRRCQQVWAKLGEGRSGQVLRGFAAGQRPEEAAAALNLSVKTVGGYTTKILAACREAWDLPPDHYLTYNFVREKFQVFLSNL